MKIVLDVSSIDYAQLSAYLTSRTTGVKGMAARAALSGLDRLKGAEAERLLISGASLFEDVILQHMNEKGKEMGIRFGRVKLQE